MTSIKGDRWFRPQGPAFAVALLVLIIAGSTVGYVAIEGWGVWDAFYMTIITVTTVGYREATRDAAGENTDRRVWVMSGRGPYPSPCSDRSGRGGPDVFSSGGTNDSSESRPLHHLPLRPYRRIVDHHSAQNGALCVVEPITNGTGARRTGLRFEGRRQPEGC